MKKLSFLILSLLIMMTLASCQGKKEAGHVNPLLSESTLPYYAPDFANIQDNDYRPAFEEGIRLHSAEIDSIANNPEEPTFANTLEALERAGALLTRTSMAFDIVSATNANPTLDKVSEDFAPIMAAHNDSIFLNEKLFERISHIRENMNDLNEEQKVLVEYYYDRFVRGGIDLPSDKKAQLTQINGELATLEAKFANLLVEAAKNNAPVFKEKTALDGLQDADIQSFADKAKAMGKEGCYVIPLQNTTQQPILSELNDRESRKSILNASVQRASDGGKNDTRDIILSIAKLRAEKATLLGFENFAAWKLQNQMAENPETVISFIKNLVPFGLKKALLEAKEMQAIAQKEGMNDKIEAYDWMYYAEKLRKQKYDLDEAEVRPYLTVDRVLRDGVFFAANKLYGITFKERTDFPVWNEDVKVFELFDTNQAPIGLFYFDPYKRDSKRGGAWMSNLVEQSYLLDRKPVIYNVLNIPKPSQGQPAFLSWDNVETMFHEFGHALHGFFASQTYPSLSGTNTPRDFVECPSQINEHWALDAEVLRNFARHYETNEVIPETLIEKIKKAHSFGQAYSIIENTSAVAIDMTWHTMTKDSDFSDVDAIEAKALKEYGLLQEQIPPRYRSPYFLHIWGNGYSAGYYSYLWTEMLETNIYEWIMNHGGMTRQNGDRFREMFLSKGRTIDFAKQFEAFTGHKPDVNPLLKMRGLK